MLNEFGDAAGEAELGSFFRRRALVGKRDFQAFVEKSQLPQALGKNIEAEYDLVENLRVGMESNLGAGFSSFAGFLQLGGGLPDFVGLLPNLAVAETHRNQGLGRALIEHALAHFRAAGLTHAKIETLAQNAIGNHLYPSLGFVEVARQVHFVAKL